MVKNVEVGTRLGPYRIEALIGAGGNGIVFRALDTRLDRPVAIKFLAHDVVDPAARDRFEQEARLASSLNHPHILAVYDIGEHDGSEYIVTELVDGGTLREWGRDQKRSWRKVVELLVGVADGLAAAHAAQIVHRDVKPANILIAANGFAKLADFGIAKLTRDGVGDVTAGNRHDRTVVGTVIGTPAYMSPEQATGRPVDARSDVFSFGVVLHEMLSERPPFARDGNGDESQAVLHREAAPLPDDCPELLRLVVAKALEKEPDDRYQSMRELVLDLRRVLRQAPALGARAAPATERKAAARVSRPVAAVAIVALASVAVATVLLVEWFTTDVGESSGASAAGATALVSLSNEASSIPNSIAILPFETLSDDAQNADLAEGIYADIFYELDKLDRLTVIGRRTMKRYENTAKTYEEIATETKAQSILELLVRFADDRVRINVELVRVNGPSSAVLWTEAYEENYTSRSLFEIQTDIATNIAQRLVGALSPNDESRLAEMLTENTEALSAYLRALPYSDDATEENADRCLEPIDAAVALAPDFKEAWFIKGRCHDIRGAIYFDSAAEEQQRAVAALDRAIAIDGRYADAHAYRASALGSRGDWREAGRSYRAALDLGAARQQEALGFLFSIGHLRAAFEGAQRDYTRDPEGTGTIRANFLMLLSDTLGDTRGSDRMFEVGQRLYEPWGAGNHGRLVTLMGRAKRGQIERSVVSRYFYDVTVSSSPFAAELGSRFDDREAAVAFLRSRMSESHPYAKLDIATFAAYFDEPELALEALQDGASFFAIQTLFVWTPLFREVRQLDEFKDYLREVGIVDTWLDLGWPDLCEQLPGGDFRCD